MKAKLHIIYKKLIEKCHQKESVSNPGLTVNKSFFQ